jgi:hypothetical protein
MKVNSLIKHLKALPKDYDVVLNRFLIIPDDEGEDCFHVRLDVPVIGTASNEENKEVLLILNCDKKLAETQFNAEVEKL